MERFLSPDIIGVMIPVIAIVVTGAVVLGRAWITHRERMAMIEMGLHPDHPPPPPEDPEAGETDGRPALPPPGEEATLPPRDRLHRR